MRRLTRWWNEEEKQKAKNLKNETFGKSDVSNGYNNETEPEEIPEEPEEPQERPMCANVLNTVMLS